MNKNIKIEIALSVILVVTLIFGLLFWIVNKRASEIAENTYKEEAANFNVNNPIQTHESDIKQISEAELLPTTTNIDSSDWETYVDKKYGFQFKYPKEWSLSVRSYYSGAGGIRGIDLVTKNAFGEASIINLGVFEQYNDPKDLFDYLHGYSTDDQRKWQTYGVIAGQKAYMGKTLNSYTDFVYVITSGEISLLVGYRAEQFGERFSGWENVPTVQTLVNSISFFP